MCIWKGNSSRVYLCVSSVWIILYSVIVNPVAGETDAFRIGKL